jgi:hypothetical protein
MHAKSLSLQAGLAHHNISVCLAANCERKVIDGGVAQGGGITMIVMSSFLIGYLMVRCTRRMVSVEYVSLS